MGKREYSFELAADAAVERNDGGWGPARNRDATRPYAVVTAGGMLRTKAGAVRTFKTYAAARKAFLAWAEAEEEARIEAEAKAAVEAAETLVESSHPMRVSDFLIQKALAEAAEALIEEAFYAGARR